MILRLTSVVLFFFSSVAGAAPFQVDISAKSAILMNAETGAVLWEKNAHQPCFPASTTKIYTALYALEKKGGDLDRPVTASYEALATVAPHLRRGGAHPPYRLEFGGTHISIKVGETLPFRSLLHGLLLASGNDAANVIAEYVSGNITAFMEELNRFAQENGCLNTILHTPHGLPHPDHTTTAYDLGLFACKAMRHPFFREAVGTVQSARPETNKQPQALFQQHNALIKQGRFFYPKAVGIKTGYTISGGYSIVAGAEDSERKLIAVILGCEKLEQRYKDAIALFEAGFNEQKARRTLFSRGFDLFTHSVEGAKGDLQAYLPEDIVLEYYPSEEPSFKALVEWLIPRYPITEGKKVAELKILSSAHRVLASAPLLAVRKVEPTMSYRAKLAWKWMTKGGGGAAVMSLAGLSILAGCFYYSRKRPFHKKK